MSRNFKFLVGTFTFLCYLPFSRLDPDPHHDGVQVASAIGVSEGLKVHTQVFNQYGPITNWAQSFWLLVTPNTLLSLRIWGCLMIAISAVLIVKLCMQTNLPRGMSFLVSLSWAAACPVWTFDPGFFGLWPWPSLLYLVFSLTAISYAISWCQKDLSSRRDGLMLGIILGIAALTRINYGVPLLLGTLVGITLFVLSKPTAVWRDTFSLFLGLTSSIGLVICVLWFSDSLTPFIDQAILEPLRGKSAVSTGWVYFQDLYLKTSYKYFLYLGGSLLLLKFVRILMMRIVIGLLTVVLVGIELSGLTYSELFSLNLSRLLSVNRNSDLLQLSLMATVFCLVFGPLYLLKTFAWSFFKKRTEVHFGFFFITIGAMAALLQLYPLSDVYHLWWTSPFLLILFFMFIASMKIPSFIPLSIVLIFVVSGLLSTKDSLEIPRKSWSSGVLNGMMIPDQYFDGYVSANRALEGNSLHSRYLCRDGLWAVWRGSYQSSTPNYVEWGFAKELKKDDDSVVVCDWPGDGRAADFLNRPVISTGGPDAYDYSRFSGGYFLEVLGR